MRIAQLLWNGVFLMARKRLPHREVMSCGPYLTKAGVTSEDLGRIAVLMRKHAATNPDAWFYEQPITLEEHQTAVGL